MPERKTAKTLDNFWRLAVSIAALLCVAGPVAAQQAPTWPERWLAAGLDFGKLRVAYRLTDDCNIDPDFEITESPNLDVTREEILGSLQGFLAAGTRDDPPREVLLRVLEEVRDPERDPNLPIPESEIQALIEELERLGPWPKVRIAQVSSQIYRCTFDVSGALVRSEVSAPGEDQFSDFAGDLSEEGPFFFSWYIEE